MSADGLVVIIESAGLAANFICPAVHLKGDRPSTKSIELVLNISLLMHSFVHYYSHQHEELGAQCARALRNISVNRNSCRPNYPFLAFQCRDL